MTALVRWCLDQLGESRRPSLDDPLTRLARVLAQPPSCPDDARIGSHRTQDGGPAHPQRPVAWATSTGVNLQLLHSAHSAHQVTETRLLEDSSARMIRRPVRRQKRATVTPLRVRRTA